MHAIPDLHSSLTVRLLSKGPEYLRRQMGAGTPGRRSAVERLAADKAKYVKRTWAEGRARSRWSGRRRRAPAVPPCSTAPPIARRSTPRRQMRPDSLVIYRQKCEQGRGQSQDGTRGSLVRRLFQGPGKEKQLASPEMPRVIMEDTASTESKELPVAKHSDHEPSSHGAEQTAAESTQTPGLLVADEVKEVKRRGLHRSQSDISSRYSKSFAEFDTFFKYCGLEQEVIEDLGRENFSVVSDNVSFKIRSISVATSESDFTRHSGDEGLLEDELTEQVPSSTSVIERNARIIKWLYTCKKAKETNKAMQELRSRPTRPV
uniref:Family with sequence similarity 110 member C n=1 Tax=Anas platyrhynchos platyrhynchos TaxID=8840 RepID=A0A493TX97_ANAPP